jgi:prepilin-type N-terminal cleavage/methylation domain-containing protein
MSSAPLIRRLRRAPSGFTLIELLIVVIIIGILISIGVPAYLKYVASAKDRDAQATLRTAYKAAITGDTEVNSARLPVATTIVQDIQADEPGISVARGSCLSGIGSVATKQVLVDPSSTSLQIVMCTPSASGTVWKLTGPLTGTPSVSDASLVALTFTGNEITDATRALGTQGDGLTGGSSTGVWEATTNLSTNGGFESNQTGWGVKGPGVMNIRRDSMRSKFGTWAGKLATDAADVYQGATTPTFSVVSGTVYTASVWVWSAASDRSRLHGRDRRWPTDHWKDDDRWRLEEDLHHMDGGTHRN